MGGFLLPYLFHPSHAHTILKHTICYLSVVLPPQEAMFGGIGDFGATVSPYLKLKVRRSHIVADSLLVSTLFSRVSLSIFVWLSGSCDFVGVFVYVVDSLQVRLGFC